MDEEIIAQETVKKGKKPIILAVIIAAVVIVVAIAIVSRLGRPASFDAAEYMPSDVALAVTLDMTSSEGKNAARTYIEGILKDAGVKDYQKDIFESINKEYKIDVQKDVLPHINGLGGLAVLPQMSGFSPDAIFVVGANSSSDAKELVKLFTSKQTKPVKSSYEGYEYYNLSEGPQSGYIGAISNAVIISSTTSAFNTVVDTIKKKKTNLLTNSDFKNASESSGNTFAVTYFSGPNFYKMMSPMLAMGAAQAPPGSMDSVKQSLESVVMIFGNAAADSDGIHYKSTTVMKEDQPTAPIYKVKDLVKGVPADAGFFVSINGYDKIWNDAKSKMMKDPATKAQYDEASKKIKQMLNIDLEKDLMDNLKGLSFYIVPTKGDIKGKSMPANLVLVIDTKDPAIMSKTLQKVNSAIAMNSQVQFKPLAISGGTASIAVFKDNSMQIADTVAGGKLVFVMSGTDAKTSLNSGITALSSKEGIIEAPSFKNYVMKNSGKCSTIMYGDVSKFINAYSSDMSVSDKKKADAIMKKVSIFYITSTNSGKETESLFEIPFLK